MELTSNQEYWSLPDINKFSLLFLWISGQKAHLQSKNYKHDDTNHGLFSSHSFSQDDLYAPLTGVRPSTRILPGHTPPAADSAYEVRFYIGQLDSRPKCVNHDWLLPLYSGSVPRNLFSTL